MSPDIQKYNDSLIGNNKSICETLATEIYKSLPESTSKVWHGHPVWFLDGNPVVGYSTIKAGGIHLLFWSGQSFDEKILENEGKFKAAGCKYDTVDQIDIQKLQQLLQKSREIQWDYKNIVKRGGVLERLK